jgi:uncharacterized delta-60 repeat protein
VVGSANTITGDSLTLAAKMDGSGNLDTSFGSSGISVKSLLSPLPERSFGHAIAVDNDGNVILAGQTDLISGDVMSTVIRLKADGDLDAGFAGSGFMLTDALPGPSSPRYTIGISVAVDAMNRIVVAGGAGAAPSGDAFFAARYLPDGRTDRSFNKGTPYLAKTTYKWGHATSVSIDGHGKIVLSGVVTKDDDYFNAQLAAQRLDDDGSPDATFGDGAGEVVLDGNAFGGISAFTQSGDILVAGTTTDSSAFVWASLINNDPLPIGHLPPILP